MLIAQQLTSLGYSLWATKGTHEALAARGIAAELAHAPSSEESPTTLSLLEGQKVHLVINTTDSFGTRRMTDGYRTRRKAVDSDVPLMTNLKDAQLLADALVRANKSREPRSMQEFYELSVTPFTERSSLRLR